jgi:hypothetical protein
MEQGAESEEKKFRFQVLGVSETELLGTTKPPPDWVSTDPLRRGAYYFASYRFVKYLIETKDMETFWKLYTSENPEIEIKSLYGL